MRVTGEWVQRFKLWNHHTMSYNKQGMGGGAAMLLCGAGCMGLIGASLGKLWRLSLLFSACPDPGMCATLITAVCLY